MNDQLEWDKSGIKGRDIQLRDISSKKPEEQKPSIAIEGNLNHQNEGHHFHPNSGEKFIYSINIKFILQYKS